MTFEIRYTNGQTEIVTTDLNLPGIWIAACRFPHGN